MLRILSQCIRPEHAELLAGITPREQSSVLGRPRFAEFAARETGERRPGASALDLYRVKIRILKCTALHGYARPPAKALRSKHRPAPRRTDFTVRIFRKMFPDGVSDFARF